MGTGNHDEVTCVRRARIVELILICICTLGTSSQAAPLDLHQWNGRVVYVDFWASWCAPCRQSFPWMQKMEKAYDSQGLTIIAINVDQSRADAERFLQRFHTDFAVRFDPSGSLAEQYKVTGMPTSVIFDRHGAVRFTHVGFLPVNEQKYEQQIRGLLAEH
jgi:thiol-disulfide isomerase/thioredoxin